MNKAPAVWLSIVVPCYNEEAVLPETSRRLIEKLGDLVSRNLIAPQSAIYFIDDGSRDKTWQIIEQISAQSPYVHGIKLSGNRGHQNALLAGLLHAPGDVLISMDADLQDDINAVDRMLEKYAEGYEIVFGVRSSRDGDSSFKRTSAEIYYRMLQLMGVNLVFNHADYRLMGRQAVTALESYHEVNLFLRGLIPTLGFPSTTVQYARGERFAGESKYPLRRMLSFAWNGITSFSNIPLRLITSLGILTSLLSLIMLVWVLLTRYVFDDAVPGWASITIPLFFLGGVQLLSLGVIGEYVAKIYLESKARPKFIIEKQV